MPKSYNPLDWYWLRSDEKLYTSARQKLVAATDKAFIAWSEDGTVPTPWPKDASGTESDDELQAVLTPYGLTMNGSPAAAPLTFMAFLALFSSDEQTAIVSSDEPQIRLFCLMAAGANGVELSDPRTVAGTTQLETLKLIAKGRAKQVLAGQAPPAPDAAA